MNTSIEYEAAVEEIRRGLAVAKKYHSNEFRYRLAMRIGQLVDRCGTSKLKRFAADIGVDLEELKTRRKNYRAYAKALPSGEEMTDFSDMIGMDHREGSLDD